MQENDGQIAAALRLVKTKLEGFRRERDLSVNASSKVLKVPRRTLEHILKSDALPSPETLQKFQKHGLFTDVEVQQLEVAYSRRITLARSKGQATRAGRPPQNSVPEAKPLGELEALRVRVERLEQLLLGSSTQAVRPTESSVSFEALLNGEGMEHYIVGDLPQVLTAANFRPIDARMWTPEQRKQCSAYVAWLVDVLRKYLNIVAQLEPEDFRRELLKTLHPRLDQMWRSFKVATSVNPPRCVELMQLEDSLVSGTKS